MKRVCGPKQFIVTVESGCVKLYPTSQGGPEVTYLLQGGMSGKESFFGNSLQTSRYLISIENCFEPTSLFLLSWSEMLGVPHLHVEKLGALSD
jgi:hypothetical protein